MTEGARSAPLGVIAECVVIGAVLPAWADEVQSTSYPISSGWEKTMRRREFMALLGGAVAAWPLDVLARVGRRSAIERMAQFFMELAERRSLIGLANEGEFRCPLSLFVLADALELSAIHVARVMRQLRERDLLTFRGGKVRIHDLSGLRRLAGYQGGYLNSRVTFSHQH